AIALKAYLSPRHSSRTLNQANDRSARDRLSGTGFADHAQDLALRHVERYIVDGDEPGPAVGKFDPQISHAEHGLDHLSLGFKASRSQSPSRLIDSDRRISAMAGNSRIHHSPENRNC